MIQMHLPRFQLPLCDDRHGQRLPVERAFKQGMSVGFYNAR
jgi:hypothetical protein